MGTTSTPVPRRRWGRSGLSIPAIPFGTQGFGNLFGPVAEDQATALVHRAIALGVDHFDRARCYGDSLRTVSAPHAFLLTGQGADATSTTRRTTGRCWPRSCARPI